MANQGVSAAETRLAEHATKQRTFFHSFLEKSTKYNTALNETLQTRKTGGMARTYRLDVNLHDLAEESTEPGGQMMTRVIQDPAKYLPYYEQALHGYCQAEHKFTHLDENTAPVRIALSGNFGKNHVSPRGLQSSMIGQLVCVEGVVTSISTSKARVMQTVYTKEVIHDDETYNSGDPIPKGKFLSRVMAQRDNTSLLEQDMTNQSKPGGAYADEWEVQHGWSEYKDQQKIILQEAPENAPTGSIPRAIECIIEQDLVDTCKPGDRVRLIGVYKVFPVLQNGGTHGVFPNRIIANNLQQIKGQVLSTKIISQDVKEIKKIGAREDFFSVLSRSIAPSISGNEDVKKGLLLTMVGGEERNFQSGAHLRGDLNILLIGDPSAGKSQMCRFVLNLQELAISTTGRGSSGVGLTAAVKVDRATGERTLEAGAMVLGDRGTVIIDEFDKMGINDRTAIHEVMEQQTVTIAKAGIHTTLNARCSVVAAANPIHSTWDDRLSLHENISLPDSLLSRFDLIYVMRDVINDAKDRKISDQVIRQLRYKPDDLLGGVKQDKIHSSILEQDLAEDEAKKLKPTEVFQQNHPSTAGNAAGSQAQILTVDFLKKYLKYAKSRVHPELSREACEQIGVNYAALRQRMLNSKETAGQLAVTTRTLEAMIRLSTAHAKLRLSKTVELEDVDVTHDILLESRALESAEAKELRMAEADAEEESEDEAADALDDDDDLDGDALGGKKAMKKATKAMKKAGGKRGFDLGYKGMSDLLDEVEDESAAFDKENGGEPTAKKAKKTNKFASKKLQQFGQILSRVIIDMKKHSIVIDTLEEMCAEEGITAEEVQECLDDMVSANKVMIHEDEVFISV